MGVHIGRTYRDAGFEASHFEADDSGPLGAERFAQRKKLLTTAMAAAEASRAEATVEAPPQDALSVLRSMLPSVTGIVGPSRPFL